MDNYIVLRKFNNATINTIIPGDAYERSSKETIH